MPQYNRYRDQNEKICKSHIILVKQSDTPPRSNTPQIYTDLSYTAQDVRQIVSMMSRYTR